MNVFKEIQKARANIVLFSLLLDLVKELEEVWPDQGMGAVKLQMVRVWLETNMPKFESLLGSIETLWPIVESMVGAIVRGLNAAGVFKKKAQ